MNARRWMIAESYRERLRDVEGIKFPTLTRDAKTNWHLFYILVDPCVKDWVIDALRAEGVTANIHYHPLHLNPYYREVCRFQDDEFQSSVKFFQSLVRLPMYSGMSDQDGADVVAAVRKVIPHSKRLAQGA
jgi:dTDP-4-amino-4,6-dideoxygalactose transaminase